MDTQVNPADEHGAAASYLYRIMLELEQDRDIATGMQQAEFALSSDATHEATVELYRYYYSLIALRCNPDSEQRASVQNELHASLTQSIDTTNRDDTLPLLNEAISVPDRDKLILDAIEVIRSKLQVFPDDTGVRVLGSLSNEIPQFAVVGQQGSGKSAVLRRLTGMQLPEGDGGTTRLVTFLELRHNKDELPIEIVLGTPSGEVTRKSVRQGDTARVIHELQASAVTMAKCNDGFPDSNDYFIRVIVRRPSVPNVTLIDLPGFTNSSEAKCEAVKNIVRPILRLRATNVLHVIKATQDFSTVLGNEELSEHLDKTMHVITHCDELEICSRDDAMRVYHNILLNMGRKCFAILGNFARSDDDELPFVRSDMPYLFDRMNNEELAVGAVSLKSHINERISSHLQRKWNLLEGKLKSELGPIERELAMFASHYSPAQVYGQIVNNVVFNDFKRRLPEADEEFRHRNEQLKQALRDYLGPDPFNIQSQAVINRLESIGNKTRQGQKNPRAILEAEAEHFAEYYETKLIEHSRWFEERMRKVYSEAFSETSASQANAKPAMDYVKQKIDAEFVKLRKKSETVVEDLIAWNRKPLAFLVDEVPFNKRCHDLFQQGEQAWRTKFDSQQFTWDLELYCKVYAYLEDQTHLVIEAMAKQMLLIFRLNGERIVSECIGEVDNRALKLIPVDSTKKRQKTCLSIQKQVLVDCLELVQTHM